MISNATILAQKMARQPQLSAKEIASSLQATQMLNAKSRAYELVKQYNTNPREVDSKELPTVLKAAEMYGWSTDRGRRKDTANWWDAVSGFALGGVDAVLLGLLKNEWYKNRRNKNWATAGHIAGIAASLFTPASWLSGAKAATGVGKVGTTLAKYATLPGLTAGAKRAIGAAKLAQTLGGRGLAGGALNAAARGAAKGSWQKAAAQAMSKGGAKGLAKLAGSKGLKGFAGGALGKKAAAAVSKFGGKSPYIGLGIGGYAGVRGFSKLIEMLTAAGDPNPYQTIQQMYQQGMIQMPQRQPQQQRIS